MAEAFDVRKTSVVPVSPGVAPLSKADGPQSDGEIFRDTSCREAEGALMWIATMTRLDFLFTAHTTSPSTAITQGPHTGKRLRRHSTRTSSGWRTSESRAYRESDPTDMKMSG